MKRHAAPAPYQLVPEDLLVPGNINLHNRPMVKNPDGSISTVQTIGIDDNGREVVIPTISDDGRHMTDEEARQQYWDTGKHFGMFRSPEAGTAFAIQLHKDQEREYLSRGAAQGGPASALDAMNAALATPRHGRQ